jgi:arsenate reductase-like glutaredoxin family protein
VLKFLEFGTIKVEEHDIKKAEALRSYLQMIKEKMEKTAKAFDERLSAYSVCV